MGKSANLHFSNPTLDGNNLQRISNPAKLRLVKSVVKGNSFGHKMNPRNVLIFISILLISAGAGLSHEFSLKISGGPGFISPGQINSAVNAWVDWQTKEAIERRNWELLSETRAQIKASTEFEVELIYSPHPRVAFSLSGGFIYSELRIDRVEVITEKPTGSFQSIRPQKITAMPFGIHGYVFQPLVKNLRIFARIGGGWMTADYHDREGSKNTTGDKFNYPFSQSAEGSGSFLSAGLGISWKTGTGLAFFLEGNYRRSLIAGFTGSDKSGDSGMLYSYEEYDPDLDFWQYKIGIHPNAPAGESIRAADEAQVDLSGFVIRIGVLIRF